MGGCRHTADHAFGDKDLMGVPGDTLFADPLGIRQPKQGKIRAPEDKPLSPSRERHRPAKGEPMSAKREPSPEPEPSLIQQWVGAFTGAAMTCCSMRDRTFPTRGTEPPKPMLPAPCTELNRPADVDDASRGESLAPSRKPSAPQQREIDLEPSPRHFGGRHGVENFGRQPQPQSGAKTAPPLAPQSEHAEEKPLSQVSHEKPPAGHLGKWEWPPWVLNKRSPCVEVFVEDADTPGGGRWVKAEPQSRVVDKAGHDAYLCAEYKWDDDYYIQDFGPHHVRKVGNMFSVMQAFDKTTGGIDLDNSLWSEDSGRTQRKSDTGAGVASFLEGAKAWK